MNKIQIVNWLLTRRCNLNCDYCRIVKNYRDKPIEYPDMIYYARNEMSTDTIIFGLEKLKRHNPNCFMIFYGGEPLLRKDLPDIINYCNTESIPYTIISNNTEKVYPLMESLFKRTNYIEGFTASIDPIIYQDKNNDIFKKSFLGLQRLLEYKSVIKDVVAEITVTNDNLQYLLQLCRDLTEKGINGDITFVDIAKSKYYDFSDVEDDDILVRKTSFLRDTINQIMTEKLNVHMRDSLLPRIYDILPSELDCGLEKDFHNMTVDSDGSLRLCLRVKGVAVSNNFTIDNILDEGGNIHEDILKLVDFDKRKYCMFCNHSCYIMSQMISDNEENSNNLIHSDIRG